MTKATTKTSAAKETEDARIAELEAKVAALAQAVRELRGEKPEKGNE